MKSFLLFCVVVCAASAASGHYYRGLVDPAYYRSYYNYGYKGLINPGPCKPEEFFFGDCALEITCDTEIKPKHFSPVPVCGCRCGEGHARDLITGLCRPVNTVGQC